jgi:hypothetical protein
MRLLGWLCVALGLVIAVGSVFLVAEANRTKRQAALNLAARGINARVEPLPCGRLLRSALAAPHSGSSSRSALRAADLGRSTMRTIAAMTMTTPHRSPSEGLDRDDCRPQRPPVDEEEC